LAIIWENENFQRKLWVFLMPSLPLTPNPIRLSDSFALYLRAFVSWWQKNPADPVNPV
jgi:hypothetical protein